MPCTTLLVGKKATNDGSTIIARNEDSLNGTFTPKSMTIVLPKEQPRVYTTVLSHLTIQLPKNPMRYSSVPNTSLEEGIWAEAGINEADVAMSATETISSNPRVLGADPLVVYEPARGTKGKAGYVPEKPGGIGEEDLTTIVLPYIKTAREGVLRMGELLETYGTYEMNGVAFSDENEVWYIETIGGHHWIARRVPDDHYVAQPNQQGIDIFDLEDAYGRQEEHLCSADLAAWMAAHNLCMDITPLSENHIEGVPAKFNAREAFGSRTQHDALYNAPRKWWLCKTLSASDERFKGDAPLFGPESFDIPWAMKPDAKLSASDVKDLLSSTYNGTEFNCYDTKGSAMTRHHYRNIGINRTSQCAILCIRPNAPKASRGVQWISFGSMPFNTAIAIFANVNTVPSYLETDLSVSTDKLYWQNRLIAALADPEFFENSADILTYQEETMAAGYESICKVDAALRALKRPDTKKETAIMEKANQELCDMVHKQTDTLLAKVLHTRSMHMRNAFSSNDH